MNTEQELIDLIKAAKPANEAEVETKVLLHVFKLLGYTDIDRADKPTIIMYFGREKMNKVADFVLYFGANRTPENALVAVETKAVGEDITKAEAQAKSYATWAWTPFYLACNGDDLIVQSFMPGNQQGERLFFALKEIDTHLLALQSLVGKTEAILHKERIGYFADSLPKIENLSPSAFFRFYLEKLSNLYKAADVVSDPLVPQSNSNMAFPRIPVTVTIDGSRNFNTKEMAELLSQKAQRIIVDGYAGSGKSTFCHRLVQEITENTLRVNNDCLPILISLAAKIPETITEAFEWVCGRLHLPAYPRLFESAIKRAHAIIILDGLDEIAGLDNDDIEKNSASIKKLSGLLNSLSASSVLISSRPEVSIDAIQDIEHAQFRHGNIRDITTDELRKILLTYIKDATQVSKLIEYSSAGLIPTLDSPMLALMAIRLANNSATWHTGTIFSIYEEYIALLHKYFNSINVRGNGEPVNSMDLLRVLSEAAMLISQSAYNADSKMLSMQALVFELNNHYRHQDVSALINTGLITRIAGRCAFIHKSFEDFGIANYMLAAVRSSKKKQFGVKFVSAQIYRFIISDIKETDIEMLFDFSEDLDKHTRKRAITLLAKLPKLSRVPISFWDRLDAKETPSNWTKIVQILNRNDPNKLNTWVLKSWKKLGRRKLNKILQIIDITEKKWLPLTLSALEGSTIIRFNKIFENLSLHASEEQLDNIYEKYKSSSITSRKIIIEKVSQNLFKGISLSIARKILLNEADASLLIRSARHWIEAGLFLDFAYTHISSVLNNKSAETPTDFINDMKNVLAELRVMNDLSVARTDTDWLIREITSAIG